MRIIEIGTDGRYLSKKRGFLSIADKDSEVAKIPLSEISALIVSAHGVTYSNNLLVELANRGLPMVICGSNHLPIALLLGLDGYHKQAERLDMQITASKNIQNNLWKQIIQSKIRNQASVLAAFEKPANLVLKLANKVKTGDPQNIEAQAARRYFPTLFGKDFIRDRGKSGINSMLNYGYIILRSIVARKLIASGLHAGIAIHHKNANNPMRLVDDLMEPFRPYVDLIVYQLYFEDENLEITKEVKAKLVEIKNFAISIDSDVVPLQKAVEIMINSLVKIYMKETKQLSLPTPDLQIWK